MFTPKWKKDATHLVKGARKFLHYKRDLLKPERIDEIESRRTDLLAAIKSADRKRVDEASKQLRAACENSLPYEKPTGWLEENVEVMFVAIVIALGLRAYYLQPFRIPTGSMQPTLNGITGTPLPKAEWPALPVRLAEAVLRGRKYVHIVNDRDRTIAFDGRGNSVYDIQHMHFFSRSLLNFHDSKPLRLPAPANPMKEIGLLDALREAANQNNGRLAKDTVLAEGIIDSGDLVLVNKFSYHFRKPKRGEVFVFDTRGITGIHERGGEQGSGSHYIKRLVGVPGDTLSIQPPHLLIDGKIAAEPGIRRVSDGREEYAINPGGYIPADPREVAAFPTLRQSLGSTTATLTLHGGDAAPGMRQYAALGDNTGNSLDSRYWGAVHEFNLVGPAAFSLWPVTTGHWGFIR
ncbi:MAG: signal peptidase I [Luteolibacter sp.]